MAKRHFKTLDIDQIKQALALIDEQLKSLDPQIEQANDKVTEVQSQLSTLATSTRPKQSELLFQQAQQQMMLQQLLTQQNDLNERVASYQDKIATAQEKMVTDASNDVLEQHFIYEISMAQHMLNDLNKNVETLNQQIEQQKNLVQSTTDELKQLRQEELTRNQQQAQIQVELDHRVEQQQSLVNLKLSLQKRQKYLQEQLKRLENDEIVHFAFEKNDEDNSENKK